MLFINDIVNVVNRDSSVLLYADDLKVFRQINCNDDHYLLQSDINALMKWSIDNKMKFHPNKCKVFKCTLKKKSSNFIYTMSGTSLKCTNCEKDLGVMVTVNLNFNFLILI